MNPGGRVGMIAPSGVYTDNGSTALRGLLLDHCDWQWLFGFENRQGIFDIHRSYKFCFADCAEGGQTPEIRTAFMRGNVNDWDHADEHVMVYPRERRGGIFPEFENHPRDPLSAGFASAAEDLREWSAAG